MRLVPLLVLLGCVSPRLLAAHHIAPCECEPTLPATCPATEPCPHTAAQQTRPRKPERPYGLLPSPGPSCPQPYASCLTVADYERVRDYVRELERALE